MKGIVFTEFLEMVEDKFGFDVADKIVAESELPSQGIYTAVGTYEHAEMVSLVTNLSKETQLEVPILLNAYGNHLFGQFAANYGVFFEDAKDAFTFLAGIENYIHVEVRKLYPDAELPTFDIQQVGEDELQMIYQSDRGMADFAQGLIEGCIKYFQEEIEIKREDLTEDRKHTKFLLTRSSN